MKKMQLWLILYTFGTFMPLQYRCQVGQMCPCARSFPEDRETAEWKAQHARRRRFKRASGQAYRRGKTRSRTSSRSADYADEDRIAFGYGVRSNRPWLARLSVVNNNGIDAMCGGSLVNRRYILTARHCVCGSNLPCKNDKPAYPFKERIKVYLGINRMVVTDIHRELDHLPRYTYGVDNVIIYDMKQISYDVALIKLNRTVELLRGVVEPVCISDAVNDTELPQVDRDRVDASVAGWGLRYALCTTDEKGPVKNLRCKEPEPGSRRPRCETMASTPSARNPICRQLQRQLPNRYPEKPGQTVIVTDANQTFINTTLCNAFDRGPYGWCRGVGKYPSEDKNWGWCTQTCSDSPLYANLSNAVSPVLQETELQVLSMFACKHLIERRSIRFEPSIEFCAGRKKTFPLRSVFLKNGDTFVDHGGFRDFLGLPDEKDYMLNFYVAGTDSCAGDSGGPLVVWEPEMRFDRAVMIGIVSRGYGSGEDGFGCAELNFPGIYIRASKIKDWVQKHAMDGNCTYAEVLAGEPIPLVPKDADSSDEDD